MRKKDAKKLKYFYIIEEEVDLQPSMLANLFFKQIIIFFLVLLVSADLFVYTIDFYP